MPEIISDEQAKAVQELAKTAQRAIDAGQQFGGFFSKHFGGILEQCTRLVSDTASNYRKVREMNFMVKSIETIHKLGLEGKIKPLSFKIGVPLLEAASLEDNDYLRELWTNLLINSVRQDQETTHPAYVQVLQQLLPEEAKLLAYAAEIKENNILENIRQSLSGASFEDTSHEYIEKKMIAFAKQANVITQYRGEPVLSWFDNLIRLEVLKRTYCYESIYHEAEWDEGRVLDPRIETSSYEEIWITSFGRNFINAVTIKEHAA
jgi:hypothetical protein